MKRLAVPLVVGILLMAPVASAAWGLGYEPASPVGESVSDLYDTIMIAGTIVFLLVEALLIFTIFKWRKNRKVPAGETERGHTTAEIAWTAIPAVILVWIGILTLNTMALTDLEDPAGGYDFEVNVYAQQFYWSFEYPDGTTSENYLRLQEGETVKLNVRSNDVQHSFWVREFGVKIDAYPDRVNHFWVRGDDVGTYKIQCAELCGVGHGMMRGEVDIFPAGEVKNAQGENMKWGGISYTLAKASGKDFPVGPAVGPGPEFEVATVQHPVGDNAPWGIDPGVITVNEGDNVHIKYVNPADSSLGHNLSIKGPYEVHAPHPMMGDTTEVARPGQTFWLNFTAVYPGEFQVICAVPGHADSGMVATLVVRPRGGA